MSLWYDLKGKSYATKGKESWIKSYCDRAIEILSQKITAHFEGTVGRHKAEDVDYQEGLTVKEKMEIEFKENDDAIAKLITDTETEISARKTADIEIRDSLQSEILERGQENTEIKAKIDEEISARKTADIEIRNSLQSEILKRGQENTEIKAMLAPVLTIDELYDATLDETDSSVLCINAMGMYYAEGMELAFKAPCSKSDITRVDLTVGTDIDENSDSAEIDLLSDVDIPVIDIPGEDIEEVEPVDPAEEVMSFSISGEKNFEQGNYVKILFSGTDAEVKEVYENGFFDSRIKAVLSEIRVLKAHEIENARDISDNWSDIQILKESLEDAEENIEKSAGKKVEGETFVISTESETETISEEIIAEKGAEIFNNYDGGSYEGELTEDDEEYPLDCALLGNPYESNIATGLYSSAFGGETQALGEFALSAGLKTKSVGRASAAFGYDNITNSRYSFATGKSNVTTGNTSLVFGLENKTGGEGSLAGGTKSEASGSYSAALGKECVAKGTGSVALGVGATADNPSGAFAIGNGAAATGTFAFGVGFNTEASGRSAVAIGEKSIASGRSALAVGNGVTASGEGAAAFGGVANDASTYTTASGKNSLAFGSGAEAQGKDSLAFGYKGTKSVGEASFAMAGGVASGARSVAIGESASTGEDHAMSLACGLSVKTTAKHQLVTGRYNKLGDDTLLHIVGNGADGSHRSNAYTLDENGNGWYAGTIETDAIILRSSTEGSSKKFKLTVDDSGAITVAEV